MRLPLIAALLFCLIASVATGQKSADFLDLTNVQLPANDTGPRTAGGGVSGSHDTPIPKLPLEITLLKTDQTTYAVGDRMVYEVAIKNIGDRVVDIPWSPDPDKIKAKAVDPPAELQANVGLMLADSTLYEQVVFGPWVFGSNATPGTMKKLRPGEAVRIRASSELGVIDAAGAKALLNLLPRTFDIHARLVFTRPTSKPQAQPVISANSVTIELKPRQ